MVKCVVFGCTSGYKSNPDKVHQFSAPRDKLIREKWQKCIPRKNFLLNDKSYVCQNHFKEEDIIKFWKSGSVEVPYNRWRLKKGAVPSLFPGPAYLSNFKEQRKLPAVRIVQNEKPQSGVKECDVEVMCPDIEENLYHKLVDFQLSNLWTKLSTLEENICFFMFNTKSKPIPTIEKCIKVDIHGVVSFAVNGKIIEVEEHGIKIGDSIEDFVKNLKMFEDLKVCHGGPLATLFPYYSKVLCTVSDEGFLRHQQCLLIIDKFSKLDCCNNCEKLKNILARREKIKTAGSKELWEVSPSKKLKTTEIRKKSYSLQRTVVKTKKKIIQLQAELSKSQKDMADDLFIQDKMKNMNESQKSLILECFAASRFNNSKSRRYSENWIMLCLLFNIRSPSAYKYIRASNLLPFPHPKTVRQYLASIKTTCGFDINFLQLLKKKCDQMSDMNKHGILLFDAVNLRKSICVNSSNLTYIGLEDYGGEVEGKTTHKEC